MNRLNKKKSIVIFITFFWCFSIAILAAPDARELNRQAVLAYKNGRYTEAKKLLDQAIKLDPNWAELLFFLFFFWLKLKSLNR